MRDRKLDRLFDRYRRKGDVNALGEVFDATASELLRVAMSLVHDPVEADDLLQATYLTAIEKASAYDSSRRLVPWLLGVLVHHAHDQRRKRGRAIEPDRLVEREVEDPGAAATRVEVHETLVTAIRALPAHYRDVLEPFVSEGKRASEIAHDVGRSPGTVRMQIHRGLDLLRKALPASIALGTLVTTAGPGLVAVRRTILERAAEAAPALVASGVAGGSLLGGLTLAKKTALATLGVAALSGLAWLAVGATDTRGSELAPPLEGPTLATAESSAGPAIESATIEGEGVTAEASPTGIERVESRAPTASYEAALSGLVGRVVEEDGTPVAGIRVELMELGYETLQTAADDVFDSEPPSWSVASTTTGVDGSFSLPGARAHALHSLFVDSLGERPEMQVIDQFLVPGETTDVGDVVLPGTVPTFGRIVDEAGVPLEGVRVRAGILNTEFEWERFTKTDADTLILVQQSAMLSVMIQLPPAVRTLEPRIPFVRATTGADGTFALPSAPRGDLQLLVDHPDHLGKRLAAPPAAEGRRDLGDVRLDRGRTFQGRVVDAAGDPLPGAEVRVGAMFQLGFFGPEMALLATRTETDADGRFSLSGVLEEGQVIFAARSSAERPWVVERPKDPGFVVLDIPAEYAVTVKLQNEQGALVDDAELVVYQPSLLSALEWGAILDAKPRYGEIVRIGPGHYEVRGLQKGTYVLRGRAPGFAVAQARVRARARARDVELVFPSERTLDVRVVDSVTGAPLERSAVSIVADRERTHDLARATAGEDGVAHLTGLPIETSPDAYLRVEHPHFATTNLPLALAEEQDELLVELDAGGGLALHCRHEGTPPRAPLMVELDLPLSAEYGNDYTKRFACADPAGDIAFSHLPPGRWRWRVFRRYLNGDVWGLITQKVPSYVLMSGEVNIVAGRVVEVDVETSGMQLRLELPRGTATLSGAVLENGGPMPSASLQIELADSPAYVGAETNVGVDGTYVVSELPAGKYEVKLWQERPMPGIKGAVAGYLIVTRTIELAADEQRTLDFRFDRAKLDVQVVDEDGEPVDSASVHVAKLDDDLPVQETRHTFGGGRVRFDLPSDGRYSVTVRHPTAGRVATVAELEAGDENEPVIVMLARGIPCAGTALVPQAIADEPTGFYSEGGEMTWVTEPLMRIERDDDPENYNQCHLKLDGREASFEVSGLSPGVWWARLMTETEVERVRIELGPNGRTDLTLEFVVDE